MSEHPQAYLFVHVICVVNHREALLSKPVRRVLFVHMQKDAEEKGIRIVTVNGVEDHIHCLIQLMPVQNLAQVLKSVRADSSRWLNETKLLTSEFQWEEGYSAYSVSPSSVRQVIDYIGKQEEHHKTKTLESELDVFKAPI
jgi:REP element-mobilizing transposase RayT